MNLRNRRASSAPSPAKLLLMCIVVGCVLLPGVRALGSEPEDPTGDGEYVCPMHPEVRQIGPGRCPKCSMFLVFEAKTNAPPAEPIFVSATRTRIPISQVPGAVYIVTAQEMADMGVMTVSEALRLVPGVLVQENAMKSKVTMRGTGDFPYTARVKFLVDGIPVNDAAIGAAPGFPMDHFFPVAEIERIEVVKGSATMFGAGSFWGTVNIIPKYGISRMHGPAPVDEDLSDKTVKQGHGMIHVMGTSEGEPMMTATYGQRDGLLRTSVTGQFMVHKGALEVTEDLEHRIAEIYASAAYKGFRGILYYFQSNSTPFTFRGGDNSGDEEQFHARGGVDMMPHPARTDFEYGTMGSAEEAGNAFVYYDRDFNKRKTRLTTRFSFQYRKGSGCADCHTGTGTNNTFTESRVPWVGDRELIAAEEVTTMRFFASSQVDQEFKLLLFHDVTVGAEVDADRVDKTLVVSLNSLDADGDPTQPTFQIYSGFLQDRITLVPGAAWLSGGVRADRHSLFNAEASWYGSVVLKPMSSLTLSARASSAPRFPTWDERFFALTIMSEIPASNMGSEETQSHELVAERLTSYEGSVEVNLGKKITVRVDGYVNEIENYINRTGTEAPYLVSPPPMIMVWKNNDRPFNIAGFELAVSYWHSRRFRGSLGWAFQDTETPQNPTFRFGEWQYPAAPYAPRNRLYLKLFTGPFAGLNVNSTATWVDTRHPCRERSPYQGYFLAVLPRSTRSQPCRPGSAPS